MDYKKLIGEQYSISEEMNPGQFLLGQLSAFDNRYQACADSFFKEITWKQFFAIICINLCNGNPTVNELSEAMGSSHQNVKQILLKLEKKGFVQITEDSKDKRKQRIALTKTCQNFCQSNEEESAKIISRLFEGIPEKSLFETIKVISMMEANMRAIVNKED